MVEKTGDSNKVAPLAGARIEISDHRDRRNAELSLPSRERGLKYVVVERLQSDLLSLPSRERGLKLAKVAKNKFAPEGRSPRGSAD